MPTFRRPTPDFLVQDATGPAGPAVSAFPPPGAPRARPAPHELREDRWDSISSALARESESAKLLSRAGIRPGRQPGWKAGICASGRVAPRAAAPPRARGTDQPSPLRRYWGLNGKQCPLFLRCHQSLPRRNRVPGLRRLPGPVHPCRCRKPGPARESLFQNTGNHSGGRTHQRPLGRYGTPRGNLPG